MQVYTDMLISKDRITVHIQWPIFHVSTCVYGASPVAQLVKKMSAIWETCVWSLSWEDPLEKGMASVFWPGEFLRLYSPWGCKESDTTEWLSHVCICVSLFFQSLIYFSCFQSYCYMQCRIKHTCPHILYMVNIFVGYIIIIKMAGSMRGARFKSCSHFKSYDAT